MEELDTLKTVEEIANWISEKQKELQTARDNREIVEIEMYNLQLRILELQRTIKDRQIEKNILDQTLNKARALCARIQLQVKQGTEKFWRIKG